MLQNLILINYLLNSLFSICLLKLILVGKLAFSINYRKLAHFHNNLSKLLLNFHFLNSQMLYLLYLYFAFNL